MFHPGRTRYVLDSGKRIEYTLSELCSETSLTEKTAAMTVRLPVEREKIAALCQRWQITELAFFGSVLRDDFRPESDVDVLVTFALGVEWSLFDHMAMEEELSALLGRKVDLVSRRAIERSSNWIRRQTILDTAEPFYAAR